MKKYRIELTERQLRLIAMCVEDCHRFAAGQTDMANTMNHLFVRGLRAKLGEMRDYIDLCDWADYGAANDCQWRFVAQTYLIYREIYHHFATEAGKENEYTSPTLRCVLGGEPPVITTIETDSEMSQKSKLNKQKQQK